MIKVFVRTLIFRPTAVASSFLGKFAPPAETDEVETSSVFDKHTTGKKRKPGGYLLSPNFIGSALTTDRAYITGYIGKLEEEDPTSDREFMRTKGEYETDPTMIPSENESRVIGCVCENDADEIEWMTLHAGLPQRCLCGYWFKLYKPTFDFGSFGWSPRSEMEIEETARVEKDNHAETHGGDSVQTPVKNL